MRVVLRRLGKIGVCPADDDIIAYEPSHDPNSILPAPPHGDLHPQFDGRSLPIATHATPSHLAVLILYHEVGELRTTTRGMIFSDARKVTWLRIKSRSDTSCRYSQYACACSASAHLRSTEARYPSWPTVSQASRSLVCGSSSQNNAGADQIVS
jgi:hypothetical protein